MRGGREPPCITFFIYPYDADVVLHPRQSLDFSSRGTTSPGSTGQSASPTWCLPPGQSLDSSSRGTTSAAPAGSTVMPTWCFTLAKALIFRRGAPRRPRRPALLHARRAIGLGRAPAARSFRKHKKRAAVDFSKRQLSSFHKFNTFSSGYTNIVTNGMVNRDSRVVSA